MGITWPCQGGLNWLPCVLVGSELASPERPERPRKFRLGGEFASYSDPVATQRYGISAKSGFSPTCTEASLSEFSPQLRLKAQSCPQRPATHRSRR